MARFPPRKEVTGFLRRQFPCWPRFKFLASKNSIAMQPRTGRTGTGVGTAFEAEAAPISIDGRVVQRVPNEGV